MNKGFKNYTKRINQTVGNVAEVSVNVNETDSNLHIMIPLVSTVGKCPISTSLIFDYQSRGLNYGFGNGMRLNYHSELSDIDDGFQMINNDGSIDSYLSDKSYFNVETGLTVIKKNDYTYNVSYHYEATDKQGNYMEFATGSKYPRLIKKTNGEKITLDFISNVKTISNSYGDTVKFIKGSQISSVEYHHQSTLLEKAVISYDSSNYIKDIVYYNNNNEITKKLSLYISDSQIVVMDSISGYRIRYSILNNVVTSINDGYNDTYERGNVISIAAMGNKTTMTDKYGNVNSVVFDDDDYPLYEVDNNGSIVKYEFDKETNQIVFSSLPMHTKSVNANMITNVLPTLSGVTETTVTVNDEFSKKLVGSTVKKYTGSGTIVYVINKSGIATDNITAMVFGRFVDGTYENVKANVELKLMPVIGVLPKDLSSTTLGCISSNDFDVAIAGVTASESYSYIKLEITLPEGAAMEIGGIKIIKQECGTFYSYDEYGNLNHTSIGNKSSSAVYDSNIVSETLSVDSAIVNYEYNNKNQITKKKHSYGASVEYEYDNLHTNNLTSVVAKNGNGSVQVSTSKTYTSDGRFISSETDTNGVTKTYTYNDSRGNIKSIVDSLSVVTNYEYFGDGLLKELKVSNSDQTLSSNVLYSYDDKKRISTIKLSNQSEYAFEYDTFNNISAIKVNGVTAFRYEYDVNNRLVHQYLGELSDYYDFDYTSENLLHEIHYAKNGARVLKFTFVYDTINRVAEIVNNDGDTVYAYVYDSDGRVVEIKNAISDIKYDYDNLGNVNAKKIVVNGKTVAQSYDTVNRSKGSHPGSLHSSNVAYKNELYFGLFEKDAKIWYKNSCLSPINHNGTSWDQTVSKDNLIPCYQLNSSKTLSYQLSMDTENHEECGFVSFCFKPLELPVSPNEMCLFSAKNPDDDGSIHIYLNYAGNVKVLVVNASGVKNYILYADNKIFKNEWNYFAFSFMNRNEGDDLDVGEYAININGHIDTYKKESPRIWYDFGKYPLYNIGHDFDGTNATKHINGLITCLTIAPRNHVDYKYLQRHHRIIKDYLIDNTLISDDGVTTVDFSDVNLYTTDSTIQNRFEIYPLHNSVKSINGKTPVVFEHRSVSKTDKDRNFNFNKQIKRYAYVADGSDLRYNFGPGESGTVMMRAYTDASETKQYFFDMKDAEGHTLGLFRDNLDMIRIDFNGELIDTGMRFFNDSWRTVSLSFNKRVVGDSVATSKYIDFRVTCSGYINYQVTKPTNFDYGTLELSVGKSYKADRVRYFLGYINDYRPFLGQIEMLATSAAFCEDSTVRTLAFELDTYTKVSEFDDLGMFKKEEIHKAGTPILTHTLVYKKNGTNTTPTSSCEKFYYDGNTRTRAYASDVYGRITSLYDSVLGSHTYKYDYRGFLVKEDNTTFEYDGNGNITKCGDTVFTYDSVIKDRLMSVGGKPITYSISTPLNPESYDGKTFEFEGRKLVKVTSANMEAEYIYDNSGLRVQKLVTANGTTTTTNYVYDTGKLVTECTASNRVDYLYDEYGKLYGFVYNNDKYFYIRDSLLNIIGIINSSGEEVVKYDYSAYGVCNSITGSMASTVGAINSFRYKGYYLDSETGFFYCKSRFYLPEWCRWLNADDASALHLSNGNKMNLFAYCKNNPVMYVDSNGMDAVMVTMFALGKGGLPIVGHTALFVQDLNGDWYFTQFTGGPVKEGILKFSVSAHIETVDVPQENTFEEFLTNEGYSGYKLLYLNGDYSNSLTLAEHYAKSENKDYGGYNLFTNNCAHYIEEILRAGQNDYDLVNEFHKRKTLVPAILHYGTMFYQTKEKILGAWKDFWSSLVSV